MSQKPIFSFSFFLSFSVMAIKGPLHLITPDPPAQKKKIIIMMINFGMAGVGRCSIIIDMLYNRTYASDSFLCYLLCCS